MNADDALLKAARGHDPQQRSTDQSLLPCFALKAHHIASSIDTPSDFHAFLCHAIRKAKHRILLASLYIGPAVGDDAAHEKELLMALQEACMKSEPYHRPTVQILMDASRGLRPVGGTCSAQAVYNHISPTHTNSSISSSKVYLFPALHSFLRSYIPSPLDEVAGVFHIKAYIIDDQLILTGANLSQEYFTDRQDRYIVFDQGTVQLLFLQ
jgi:CDP-diacylglycerol--glycerol-3-phosphate 3-phosphatidyltransferase